MFSYILRRLLLLPLTLFCIIMVNFLIINLAPGDPTSITEISPEGGATRSENQAVAFGSDERYLQFREHYGLTLPILFNNWYHISYQETQTNLLRLYTRKWTPNDAEEMPVKTYDQLRVRFGDQARFAMKHLLEIAGNPNQQDGMRRMAIRFFVRGGTLQGIVGPKLSKIDREWNRKVAKNNSFLRELLASPSDTKKTLNEKALILHSWYEKEKRERQFEPSLAEQVQIFFLETRFARYLSRVLTLDFGTLRNDSNRTVIREVTKRFKYSLTLAVIPMLLTFVLCQGFGMFMALYRGRGFDFILNVGFLVLYAIPVFVVGPFLIEKVALNQTFPFTDIEIPISGFQSPEGVYSNLTSKERFFDILKHIALPLVAILYGSLAVQSRLSRTAILEVLKHDYVRTARAKGLAPWTVYIKHVGRNAAITIVTSLAGSLGVILGGSLIVETLFGIDGFGRFFYEAILNRDYNVIMFSVLSGAFLSLIGYLLADIAYTLLDPRVTLD